MKRLFTPITRALVIACLILGSGPLCLAQRMDGRTVLKNMLEAEGEAVFIAHQVTTLARGPAMTSEQTVYRAGFKGMRIEYLEPPALKGEVIADDGHVYAHLIPKEKILRVGPSRLKMLQKRMDEAHTGFKQGALNVSLVGKDRIASRDAYIIQVKPNHPGRHPIRKFWVDSANWVKLKTEDVGPDGAVLSMSYYTMISFVDRIDKDKFHIEAPRGVRIVRQPEWATAPLSEIKKIAEFQVFEPTYLPKGFKAVGASLIPFRHSRLVVIRYSDGVSSLSLFQTPGRVLDPKFLARLHEGPVKPGQGMYSWKIDGVNLTIVSQIPMDEIRKVAASVK